MADEVRERAVLLFDELNILKTEIEASETDPEGRKRRKEYFIDEVTDLFVLAYVYGTRELNDELGSNVVPNTDEMRAVIEEKFDGKNYIDRLNEYLESGTTYDINRVIETDAHRIYNAAKFTGAKGAGATEKTWNCMMLPTSRDTHVYLDGTTIPIDQEFYTYNNHKAMYPSQFAEPEENCNCLCWVTFSK